MAFSIHLSALFPQLYNNTMKGLGVRGEEIIGWCVKDKISPPSIPRGRNEAVGLLRDPDLAVRVVINYGDEVMRVEYCERWRRQVRGGKGRER